MSEQTTQSGEKAVVAAARFLLRGATRPTDGSATAQVNGRALDDLRTAVKALDARSSQSPDSGADS